MGTLITDLSSPPQEEGGGISFVGAEAASSPASGYDGTATELVVPKPSGVQEGDLMLVVLRGYGLDENSWTLDTGWAEQLEFASVSEYTIVATKTAGASEGASYTFTPDSGTNLTGCILALRNASYTSDATDSGTMTVPTITNNTSGSWLIAMIATGEGDLDEDWTANSPLTERAQHVSGDSGAYSTEQSSCIATEADVDVGSISGRSFTNPDSAATEGVAAIIVEPT